MKSCFRYLLLVLPLLLFSCSEGTPELGSAASQTSPPIIATSIPLTSTPTEQQISITAYQRIGNGNLEQVKWTKDGKSIILGTTTGVFVYDAEKIALVNEFEVGRPIYYLAVHPSGEIISVGADKSNTEDITLWNVQSGKPAITLHGDCGCVFTNVTFSPDGSLLAVGTDNGQVWIWEWASGKIFRTLKIGNESDVLFIRYLQFSPDGLSLLVGSGDKKAVVELFDINSGKQLLSVDNSLSFLFDLEFSPDGKRFALAGNLMDGNGGFPEQDKVKVFDSATGNMLYEINLTGEGAYFVLFNPNNNSLITGSCKSYGTHSEVCLKAQLEQWNISDGAFEKVVKEYAMSLVSVDYSPDGKLLSVVTWNDTPLFDIWDLATNQMVKSIEWYVGPSSPIVFSPDSKTAMWGEFDGTIKFLDINSRITNSIWNSDDGAIVNLAISADGLILVSSSRYGAITLWDFHTGTVLQRIETRDNFQVYSVQFSPNNRWLAWTEEDLYRNNEDQVQIYDVEHKKTALTIMGTSFNLAISPNSSTIAITNSNDKSVRLFEISTGNLLSTFTAPETISQVEFSPNGTILVASCFNTNIVFWELSSSKLLRSFDAYSPSNIGSIPFALFPGNNYLVFSSGPNLKILDLRNYELVLEKQHFIGGTENLVISPNAEILATSRPGEAAWLWKVDGIH